MTVLRHLMPKGQTCTYCGRKLVAPARHEHHKSQPFDASRDHVIPRSVSWACDDTITGKDDWVWSCRSCNGLRGDLPQDVFTWAMANSVATTIEGKKKELQRLRYLLISAGFVAAKRVAFGHLVRPSPPKRDSKGRFAPRPHDAPASP